MSFEAGVNDFRSIEGLMSDASHNTAAWLTNQAERGWTLAAGECAHKAPIAHSPAHHVETHHQPHDTYTHDNDTRYLLWLDLLRARAAADNRLAQRPEPRGARRKRGVSEPVGAIYTEEYSLLNAQMPHAHPI